MKGKCDRSYKEDNRSQLEGSLSGEHVRGKKKAIYIPTLKRRIHRVFGSTE